MPGWIETLRTRSIEERRFYSLIGASVVVGLLFLIWATVTIGNIDQIGEASVEEEQKATVVESVKRKAGLLFGSIGEPIQYKKDQED